MTNTELKALVITEIQALKRIISNEVQKGECAHERGELYALEWVLMKLKKDNFYTNEFGVLIDKRGE